ncbi:hypothetical protein MMC11_004843 [Xylographa trunciseda]|nr:hypothetical protein [Xylographa trunciseda]
MTVARQATLLDFVKEHHPQNGASEHQTRPDIDNIKSLNRLSRNETADRLQYVSAPAASSKRQLAGQNARIQQQPTRLEHPKPSSVAPSHMKLSEAVIHTDGSAQWSAQGPTVLSIKEEYSQHQSRALDGFDTDVDDDFDDTTTMSHDIQVEDSQAQYLPLVERYTEHSNEQYVHDAHKVSGVPTYVESRRENYIDSMTAGIDKRYDPSEGADYLEEEESESDGSEDDGGAEDEPTLNSTSMSAPLSPSLAQAFKRVHAEYSNQELPQGSRQSEPYPSTSNHEEEDVDPTGHLPYREAMYRLKSTGPGHSGVQSALRPIVKAVPFQQIRQTYETDLQSASGLEVLQSNRLSRASERHIDESLRIPMSTVNTKAVKAQSSRPLRHKTLVELEQKPLTSSQQDSNGIVYHHAAAGVEEKQLRKAQKNPHRPPKSRNIRTLVHYAPGEELNENSSFSLSDHIAPDDVLLPRKDLMVNQFPQQPDVRSVGGQKRTMSLDYTEDELSKMSYEQLRTESFDSSPEDSVHMFPEEIRSGPLIKQFEYIKDRKDLTGEQQSRMLHSFFSSLTLDQYEECGDLVLEVFSNILAKFKNTRQEKRKVARKYEEEVSQREETVSGGSLRVDNEMRRIRQAGNDLINGRGA